MTVNAYRKTEKPLMKKALLITFFLLCAICNGEQTFPKPGWTAKPNPLANPDAPVGGQLVLWGGQSPKSLNPYLDYNSFSVQVFSFLYDTLLNSDPLQAGAYEPGLAEKWSISDDKKTFTFWLNPKAKWSDGQPITADDVAWTFNAIMDPKNITGPHKVSYGRLNAPKVLSPSQIQFTAKEVHWSNLGTLASLLVMPKHTYGKMDFNLINFEFPAVSGLYRLKEIKEGIYISLDRRADYWNRMSPTMKGIGNFQTIRYKIFEDRDNAYEAFLKGDIDLYPVYTARLWVKETQGEKFANNWIVKQNVSNHRPAGFQGFAMNMRRPPFDDVRVRKAISHLVNREKMNATIMYNQYFLLDSYYSDMFDAKRPCPNEKIRFNKEEARKLLKEAGWVANPVTGILEKNGTPFSFRFLDRDPSTQKFLDVFAEDLKDVGIKMTPDMKDQAAWSKDVDEFNFDMTWSNWTGAIPNDPEPQWFSKEAENKAGQNLSGLKSPQIDALIVKQRSMFDPKQQEEVIRELDAIVFKQFPYALLWNRSSVWLAYWNKFGMPATVLDKYNDESVAQNYWWYDEDSDSDLKDAVANKAALPKKDFEVDFDKAFKGPNPDKK